MIEFVTRIWKTEIEQAIAHAKLADECRVVEIDYQLLMVQIPQEDVPVFDPQPSKFPA